MRARCLCLLLVFAVGAAHAQDLDEILRRNTEALGGAEAWARVENIRVRLDIAEPGFEVSGTYVATRSGNMRIDIEAGGERVFAEGMHEGTAWQWTPDGGVEPTSEAGAEALHNSTQAPGRFFTLEQARARGAQVELIEPDNDSEFRLRVSAGAGAGSEYYIDRNTWLTTRRVDLRAFHPDMDPTEVRIENRECDPRWVDGVLRFYRSENRNLDTGAWLGTTTVRSVEHNIEIPEGYFEGL